MRCKITNLYCKFQIFSVLFENNALFLCWISAVILLLFFEEITCNALNINYLFIYFAVILRFFR